jgi:hypothetical protein
LSKTKQSTTNADEDVGKRNSYTMLLGMYVSEATIEIRGSSKSKKRTTICPAILFLSTFSKDCTPTYKEILAHPH